VAYFKALFQIVHLDSRKFGRDSNRIHSEYNSAAFLLSQSTRLLRSYYAVAFLIPPTRAT